MSAITDRRIDKPQVERTSKINTTVGTDFGAGIIVVHPVLCGSCVPFGKDGCKVRVVLFDAGQHGSARDIVEGRLEVKRNKDSGWVSLREVLKGFDHRVCSIWASNSILKESGTFGN